MSTTYQPLVTPTTGDDSWLFAPTAEDGAQAMRDACATRVLEDDIFYHFSELPQRMQASLIRALRDGDTEANDREIGRVMRAAFKRAVDEAVEMSVDRMKAEVQLFYGE